MENEKKNYVSLSDISPVVTSRFGCEISGDLTWMYGDGSKGWGMPFGAISNWIGEGGVGKSRLAISLARAQVLKGFKVLYFQNEVDLPTLSSWVNSGPGQDLKNFYCSESCKLSDQIQAIKSIDPLLVFVDSVNMLEEFGTGRDENVREIVNSYREAIKGKNTHIVLLCQLNKDGSAKGSTALTHMPDINFILTNDGDGQFTVSVGNKHRYGRTGSQFCAQFQHVEHGVEDLSCNRYYDEYFFTSVSESKYILMSKYIHSVMQDKIKKYTKNNVINNKSAPMNIDRPIHERLIKTKASKPIKTQVNTPIKTQVNTQVSSPVKTQNSNPFLVDIGGAKTYYSEGYVSHPNYDQMFPYEKYVKTCRKNNIDVFSESDANKLAAMSMNEAGQLGANGIRNKVHVDYAWRYMTATIFKPVVPYGNFGLLGRICNDIFK